MGAHESDDRAAIAFRVHEHARPALEVRVNFGVFAGRNATQAEIDDLARALHDVVESFAIVAEERHEFGSDVETSVRQIVIEVDADVRRRRARRPVRAHRRARRAVGAGRASATRSELGELGSEL